MSGFVYLKLLLFCFTFLLPVKGRANVHRNLISCCIQCVASPPCHRFRYSAVYGTCLQQGDVQDSPLSTVFKNFSMKQGHNHRILQYRAHCSEHDRQFRTVDRTDKRKEQGASNNSNHKPEDLWGPCADHKCTVGQKCTTNRVTKKALCVKGDIAKAETCPVPPKLDNAVLRSGGNKLGSSRTYTCQDGYLDTESFVTSGVTTCLPDFTWSHPNLTCLGPYISKSTHSEDWYSEDPLPKETFLNVVKDSSLVLFCKACYDCIVKLCDCSVGEIQCYQVIIHKNYRSVGHDDRIDIPGEIKCTEFRPFWISWRDGILAVGKGNTVGNQKHMERKPGNFIEINCVVLGTIRGESWWLLLRQK